MGKNNNSSIWPLIAFLVLIFMAVAYILNWAGIGSGHLMLVAAILSAVMIGVYSYFWARPKGMVWFIIWLVALIVVVVFILGGSFFPLSCK